MLSENPEVSLGPLTSVEWVHYAKCKSCDETRKSATPIAKLG